MPNSIQPSKILLDEYFAAEDQRFLDEFQKFNSAKFLIQFIDRWISDQRPWARQQVIEYTRLTLNLPGHEVVFKRLFKHYERQQDDEIMAHMMVSTDRLVRREQVTVYRYNWQTRNSFSETLLYAKPNKTVIDARNRVSKTKWHGKTYTIPLPDLINKPKNRLFTHATRAYLRRRVWRYFRKLSYTDHGRYVSAIANALTQYKDTDFASGENIIDNWSLIHACYFHHSSLMFTANHANLVEGHSLGELTAAPYMPNAWKADESAQLLIELIGNANSSLVRLWAMELLKQKRPDAIDRLEVSQLIALLSSVDPRVQEFAAELFSNHGSLSSLRIESWLELLEQTNPSVLLLICDAMKNHVSVDRLETSQIIDLVCARPVPVSRLGFEFLQTRNKKQKLSNDQFKQLAATNCEQTSTDVANWILQEIGDSENYQVDTVIELFDSLQRPMRAVAMDWIVIPDSTGHNDPVLWSRLVETPHDDIRLRLIESLETRLQLPDQNVDRITPLWVAVILGVHRGGRTKLKAVRQIAGELSKRPDLADSLLPVLAVAVRSVREPEKRCALAAVAGLVHQNHSFQSVAESHLPELDWMGSVEETIA